MLTLWQTQVTIHSYWHDGCMKCGEAKLALTVQLNTTKHTRNIVHILVGKGSHQIVADCLGNPVADNPET